MGAYYYQIRKKKNGVKKVVTGLVLVVTALVLLAANAAPVFTGSIGQAIHGWFFQFAGLASFLIPVYLGCMGVRQFLKIKTGTIRDFILSASLFVFLSCLLSLYHTSINRVSGGLGGWLGDQVSLFLIQQLGVVLVFAVSSSIVFVCGSLLAGFSPLSLVLALKDKVVDDIDRWKEERKRLREQAALRMKLEKTAPAFIKPAQTEASEKPTISAPADVSTETKDTTSIISSGPQTTSAPAKKAAETVRQPKTLDPVTQKPGETLPAVDPYVNYILPDPAMLSTSTQKVPEISKDELYANGTLLEQTLEQFNVKAKVTDIHPGPVITRYDLSPAPGVRVQAFEALSSDIALAMKAQSLRVLAPVPGKAAVGFEISNPHPATVFLKEIVGSPQFQNSSKGLPIGLGKMTEGEPLVSDLAAMPHLLIAGATGSGKSVCIHALILSILFRFRPDEVKLLLIDPKRLELPIYDGLPHLYDPSAPPEDVKVITQSRDVVQSLKKLIDVMEERYRDFARLGVRNIESYNEKAVAQKLPKVPYLVVIIDELADLMIIIGREIEDLIQRLAQMARAVGIHLVLATQRPSVDVITGVIKANLPSRIAFQVLSKTDSRVILDSQGAENLLGKGDMLFLATGATKPVRLQGAFISEADVNQVIQVIKDQNFKPSYQLQANAAQEESVVDNQENRQLLVRAAKVVRDTEKVSGDLLRADKEIGSRYDLALTLLKKKGLIEKPKDTNRWKIHFDRLDQYLTDLSKKA